MQAHKLNPIALLLASLFGTSAFAAPPTTGAFVTDTTKTYVQDATSDGLKLPNTVLCYMGGTGANSSSMVNQGNYIALIDKNKCENSTGSSDSGSDNLGSSSAPNYLTAIANATRTDNSSALTGKVWFQDKSLGPTNQAGIIYGKLTAAKSVTDKPPYGVFHTDYCGLIGGTGNCTTDAPFYGFAEADGATISAFQLGSGAYHRYISVKLDGDTSIGTGRVKLTQYMPDGTSISQADSGDWKFSYNADFFRRADNGGSNDQCFDRRTANADKTAWSYGVYDSSGARLQRTSGFPIQTSGGVYGYVGYWGIWAPSGVTLADGDSVSRVSYQDGHAATDSYTLVKKDGRLKKQTLNQTTLNAIKNVPFTVFVNTTFSDSGNTTRSAGTNLEVKWDGSNFVITGVNTGSGVTPDSSGKTIPSAAIQSNWSWNINGFSQSLGGSITVVTRNSGGYSAPTDASLVGSRTERVVTPGGSDWPSGNLVCISDCPKSGSDFTAGLNNTNSATAAYKDINGSTSRWNGVPVATGSALTYSANSTTGLLQENTTSVAWTSANTPANPSFGGGFQSGRLVDSSDTASLNSIRCDSNGTSNSNGSYYCPSLLGRVSTAYVWETGSNSWNKYSGLKSGSTYVNFDPPMSLKYVVPSSVSTYFANANIMLQYNSFGDLQGIPGQCVDPVTNDKVNCGQGTRWVSAFMIPEGGEVTNGSTTYYIKPLQAEIRLKKVNASNCSALTLPTVLDAALPGVGGWSNSTSIGTMPTVTGAPRVIQGEVKY